jgi:bacterioferritin-associated ferredoxin
MRRQDATNAMNAFGFCEKAHIPDFWRSLRPGDACCCGRARHQIMLDKRRLTREHEYRFQLGFGFRRGWRLLDLQQFPSAPAANEDQVAPEDSPVTSSACVSDPIVCRCYRVRESAIVQAVRSGKALDVDGITAMTKAGDGCTCCHKKLCKLLELHR